MLHNLQVEDYVYGDEDTSFFHTVTTALFAGYVCMYIALGHFTARIVSLCVQLHHRTVNNIDCYTTDHRAEGGRH